MESFTEILLHVTGHGDYWKSGILGLYLADEFFPVHIRKPYIADYQVDTSALCFQKLQGFLGGLTREYPVPVFREYYLEHTTDGIFIVDH